MRFVIIFSWIGLLTLVAGCSDIPRDNPLDPKNPDSYRQPVVLMETFVNTSHPTPYNHWAVMAARLIQQEYDQQTFLINYHRNISVNGREFKDSIYVDTQTSIRATELQDVYLEEWPGSTRGVPDIYLNGADNRIAGASDQQIVRQRLHENISQLLSQKSYYTLEADIRFTSTDQISIDCRIAPMANRKGENVALRVVLTKNIDAEDGKYTVTALHGPLSVQDIHAGEYFETTLGPFSIEESPDRVVIALTSEDRKKVYYTITRDI